MPETEPKPCDSANEDDRMLELLGRKFRVTKRASGLSEGVRERLSWRARGRYFREQKSVVGLQRLEGVFMANDPVRVALNKRIASLDKR